MPKEVRLCRHTAVWESAAAAALRSLAAWLGDDLEASRHIGSTAIRGILAVPVIDIALGLREECDVEEVLRKLAGCGYRRIPTDGTGCIRMQRSQHSRPYDAVCLWITRARSPAYGELVAFREYLNNHVFAANEYEQLKKRLAAEHRTDPAAYAAGKDAFIRGILRLSFTDQFLGRHLTVVVDHPYGSALEEDPRKRYELNCGYLPGILSPDGREPEVYIYGVHKSVRRFTGTVIAAIHRRNGTRDALVAAPSGVVAYEPQIGEAVRFLEHKYDTGVVCIYEKSCGAILYRIGDGGVIEYLVLYQHRSGTWSIPKGHIAAGETERDTALREIREETGLSVSLIDGFRRELSYTVSAKASKNVVVFLAEAKGELSLGRNEISDCVWAEKAAAIRRLGGRSIGRIIEAAEAFLRRNGAARADTERTP